MTTSAAIVLTFAAAQAQQYGRYDPGSQRYQEELMRQQQYERAQQQQYAAQAQRQRQQEAILQAQREAMRAQARRAESQSYGGSPYSGGMGGSSKPPLSKKEQKELKKKQEKDAKMLKELQKTNAKLRKKAQTQMFPNAPRGGSRRAVSSKGGGPLGFIFSFKGLMLMGAAVAAYVIDQQVLMGKLLKYPTWFASWLCRAVWSLALKPLVRFIVLRSKGGGAELPGGSY